MRRGATLGLRVFLSIVAVALGAVVLVGVVARGALSSAFDAYLLTVSGHTPGMGRGSGGRAVLGIAEQAFLSSVDGSVAIAAAVAIIVAILVAALLARSVSRPLARLGDAAGALARGDLAHRAEVSGPSEVVELGGAFNAMAASLEEAEALRRRLVADVAHELRNPIAAARAQAEGMADGVIPADQAHLDSLIEDLQHLSALVDDVQVLATADAGRLRYTMRPLDLADLVRREASRMSVAAGDTRVSHAGNVEPVWVIGDELRLAEVLRNLLGNAVRHTPGGSVETAVETLPDGRVEVRVRDNGEGIPAEALPYVFERFYRSDEARAAHTGGAGLGLAISRRIVEDHGGEVFARSRPGEETVVGFRLAAAPVSALDG